MPQMAYFTFKGGPIEYSPVYVNGQPVPVPCAICGVLKVHGKVAAADNPQNEGIVGTSFPYKRAVYCEPCARAAGFLDAPNTI